jgi:hypothetical protein
VMVGSETDTDDERGGGRVGGYGGLHDDWRGVQLGEHGCGSDR